MFTKTKNVYLRSIVLEDVSFLAPSSGQTQYSFNAFGVRSPLRPLLPLRLALRLGLDARVSCREACPDGAGRSNGRGPGSSYGRPVKAGFRRKCSGLFEGQFGQLQTDILEMSIKELTRGGGEGGSGPVTDLSHSNGPYFCKYSVAECHERAASILTVRISVKMLPASFLN